MTTSDLLGEVADDPVRLNRPPEHVKTTYSNLASAKFRDHEVDYKNQYCKLYSARLELMVPLLEDRIKLKWGTEYPVVKVYKLQEHPNTKCIVIGTIFKNQKLKPSILKKISEANSLIPQPIYTHFTDESDQLFIEDELQRYQIIGCKNVHELVTGISAAFLGVDKGHGKFFALESSFANCREQIERPLSADQSVQYICFVSGLDLVNYANNILHLKLFLDWIIGFVGSGDEQKSTAKIARVMIVGNSVRIDREAKKTTSLVAKVVESNETLVAVEKLDEILSQLVRVVYVDLMPGQHDPSNHLLVQQPMHKCMFQLAAKYETLNCVTNPHECEVAGVRILGSSGQPVTDITSYTCIEEPIEALERCLLWSHIAPTAPDTLGCYPYRNNDPFIIHECPHVLFAGNQPQFQTRLFTGPEGQTVRLICIPQFGKTFSVVLLNLNNLGCHEMSFSVNNFT